LLVIRSRYEGGPSVGGAIVVIVVIEAIGAMVAIGAMMAIGADETDGVIGSDTTDGATEWIALADASSI
jgi:hypothetical protein